MPAKSPPQQRFFRKIATIAWFHELALHFNTTNAAALRREIKPADCATPDQIKELDRKWRDYRNGRHYPSREIILAAEEKCPGAELTLKSPLWEALCSDRSARKLAKELQGKTNQHGDHLINWALRLPAKHKSTDWVKENCHQLAITATPNALATLILCTRLANDIKCDMAGVTCCFWAKICLISIDHWTSKRKVIEEINECFNNNILKKYVPPADGKALFFWLIATNNDHIQLLELDPFPQGHDQLFAYLASPDRLSYLKNSII
ncbi:hypothetical protein [Chitinolyticbacter meiyuanensis]|uniref:hypothetical protein n=1 Tax=Chitinolyticbacter meiyuanensis TaxID=682798 RepID=UPI0011E5F347|nr:hypothetical protein [Chitinolyticbacter meiyuanensis]